MQAECTGLRSTQELFVGEVIYNQNRAPDKQKAGVEHLEAEMNQHQCEPGVWVHLQSHMEEAEAGGAWGQCTWATAQHTSRVDNRSKCSHGNQH